MALALLLRLLPLLAPSPFPSQPLMLLLLLVFFWYRLLKASSTYQPIDLSSAPTSHSPLASLVALGGLHCWITEILFFPGRQICISVMLRCILRTGNIWILHYSLQSNIWASSRASGGTAPQRRVSSMGSGRASVACSIIKPICSITSSYSFHLACSCSSLVGVLLPPASLAKHVRQGGVDNVCS